MFDGVMYADQCDICNYFGFITRTGLLKYPVICSHIFFNDIAHCTRVLGLLKTRV